MTMPRRDVLKGAAAAAAASVFAGEVQAGPGKGPRITLRPAGARGHANHGWLDTWHTFSFASYHDPAHMGFRGLRVINDDRIAPGKGFAMHPHQDMEIVTYILSGALQHKDSQGNGSVIVPGEVQRMTAGTGIYHSEYNPSAREGVHLLQIWIQPDRARVRPSYAQKTISTESRRGKLKLIASPDGRDGSVAYQTGTYFYSAILSPGQAVAHRNPAGRHVWIHLARGSAVLNGLPMNAGDGASTSDPGDLVIRASTDAELLLFDLA
jgi:redox-sensitive bicupin YhaK (pirin superfamily)